MNIAQIEENLQSVIKVFSKETFIYDLLLAYGLPKASITRLQKGNLNLSKIKGEISWKKKLFFRDVQGSDLHATIDTLVGDKNAIKHNPRFVVVTDYETLLAVDTKTQDTLDVEIKDLPKHYDFFLPWAGMEKAQHQNENPADVRAAERMAKLFDEIKKDNPNESPEYVHGLNVFLSRLLFSFFAEDTNIYEEGQFTNAISSHTQVDGSDLNQYLDKLFNVLNTPEEDRKDLPEYLNAFPYVNGGLFKDKLETPILTRRSRKVIIESGELNWSAINPDIFGSMIQAVITPEHRGGLGMHYTSVPNIMKVIEPLFLNDLYQEFEQANGSLKKLNKLLYRIQKLKIFDPACGSGNFLIIAYKELRRLEMKILKAGNMFSFSGITLDQFYGIEIDDFAHEVAILSLWLAEHQMNVEFFKEFGKTNPTLPLKQAGNIVQGNATRLNWEGVCPKKEGDEIYILGNPPYLGARNQSKEQKEDVQFVFEKSKGVNSLDYIACWFLKGADFISGTMGQCSFVSTNSICQGEQVALLWPLIFKRKIEIGFAHKSFIWSNNAKNKAAVFVVIVGIRAENNKPKFLFQNELSKNVSNISPYLTDNRNVIVEKRTKPIQKIPALVYGNQAIEGGNLIFDSETKNRIENQEPFISKFIRPLYGAEDYLKGENRWCLWIREDEFKEALKSTEISKRITNVKQFRENGGEVARSLVEIPYRFRYVHEAKEATLILPRTTSERREYLTVGFLEKEVVVTDAAQVIYDPEVYIFGVLSSKLHMLWVKAVAGRLKMDPRYSNSLCYNTFPFPQISDQKKEEITHCVYRILEEREKYSEKNLAQLYDPKKMPNGLRDAHGLNDLAVERCFRSKPFESDEERLEYLFKLYEKMIAEEQEKNTLFETEQKTRKKKK